jgi:NAD(P)-dependent dehydrogenase (short-subunit alcohol dehydrogenase family)
MAALGLRRTPRDLTGKVVLITGGAQGIGRETAQRLAVAGARVAIGDKDVDQVERTGHALGVMALPLDVTSVDAWRTFVDEAGVLGPPDVLVNNAGIMPVGPILDEPESVARAMFDVNVHGTINGVKTVVPGMVERGHGHVVNIASAVGRIPSAGGATYSASKHAVVGFTDAIRQELAPQGIDVSMVLPSITRTQLALGVPDAGNVPSQTPQQVAEVIEDVVRKPVPEAWAPRWSQPLARTTGLLPRRLQALMMEAAEANVLANVDTAARSDYEAQVRGS